MHKQSNLTTSRLNEHNRKLFAFEGMQGYGDLATLGNIQPRTPSECPSVYDTDFKGNNYFNDKVSSISEGAKIRRAKAELQRRQCLERQEIERQQHALEQQLEMLRIKQELDAKKAELRNIKELSRIDNEIEQAKLEEESERSSLHVDEAKEESSYTNVSYYDQSIEGTPKAPKWQRDFPKQMGKRKLHYGSHVWRNEEHERLTNNDPIQQKQSKVELSERK